MARRRDFGIAWVLLIVAICWGAFWERDAIDYWARSHLVPKSWDSGLR